MTLRGDVVSLEARPKTIPELPKKPSRTVKNKPGCHVFSERLAASHKIISTVILMKEKAR